MWRLQQNCCTLGTVDDSEKGPIMKIHSSALPLSQLNIFLKYHLCPSQISALANSFASLHRICSNTILGSYTYGTHVFMCVGPHNPSPLLLSLTARPSISPWCQHPLQCLWTKTRTLMLCLRSLRLNFEPLSSSRCLQASTLRTAIVSTSSNRRQRNSS